MTIIEAVRQFVGTYPPLVESRLNVDFLPKDADGYSLDAVPAKSEVKVYRDGSSVRQFLFVLASRAYWGPDYRQQIDNLCFFEEFEEWIARQSRAGIFPALGEGRTAQKLEVLTSGYAFAQGADLARYQIRWRTGWWATRRRPSGATGAAPRHGKEPGTRAA